MDVLAARQAAAQRRGAAPAVATIQQFCGWEAVRREAQEHSTR
jgi:hypothetical protein